MSKKRHRERPAVDTQLVEIFEDLANVDEEIRLKAAQALLTGFVPEGRADGDQLNEILRRLIRGLCSGRKAARLGFSIALTEFLTELLGPKGRRVPGFQDVAGLIDILKKQTHASGGVSGQEERDHQFGRLFGAEAIIKSGVLFQADGNLEAWNLTLDLIFELAKKKPWLREECGFVLYQSIPNLSFRDHGPEYARTVIFKAQANGLAHTPEGVAIWVAVKELCLAAGLPKGVWHHDDPLTRKEKSRLAQILKQASVTSSTSDHAEEQASQLGTWSTSVHFAWRVILDKLVDNSANIAREAAKSSKSISFHDFWDECIDKNLFASSSSKERKYWGLLLLQRMINVVPRSLILSLFGENLMGCFVNQLASQDRYLHLIAEKTRKTMIQRARSTPDACAPILEALITSPNGDINFDGITKTKTVETLLSQMHGEASAQVVDVYDKLLSHPGVREEKLAASRRQSTADQLLSAVRSVKKDPSAGLHSVKSFEDGIQRILMIFMKYAYFITESSLTSKDPSSEPPISSISREMFRSRISACLTHLIAKDIEPTKLTYNLLCLIREREENDGLAGSLIEADKNVGEVFTTGWKTLQHIDSITNSEKAQHKPAEKAFFHSAKLLLSLTILQIYNGDPDAVSMLGELNECYDSKQLKQYSKHGFQASATLVEILLSLISKPSQLFRRLAQQIFTACASDVDEIGLLSMFKVLKTKESLAGQTEMFDQGNDSDIVSDASDVEEIDMENADSSPNESSDEDEDPDDATGSNSSTSTSSDEEGDGADEELAAFDAKLAFALGTRPGQEDLAAGDDSSSEESMNSSQMEALDTQLSTVFRERQKLSTKKSTKKAESKDAKETIVNFKFRVLDLLSIYIRTRHTSPLALTLLLPLLSLVRTTTSPPLANKSADLIREYARLAKGKSLPSTPDPEGAFTLLTSIHEEAEREGSNAHASACSQASLLLVRTLVAGEREHLRRVVQIYAGTLERMLFEGARVKTGFFTDWINWCASARK